MATSESVTPNLYAEIRASLREERRPVSGNVFRNALALAGMSADFFACAAGIFASSSVYFWFRLHQQIPFPARLIAVAGTICGLFVLLLLRKEGAYNGSGSLLRIRETERAIRVSVESLLLLLPLLLVANPNLPAGAILPAFVAVPILLICEKHILFWAIRLLNMRGYGVGRVVVYGAGETGRRVVSALRYSPRLGLSPVAVIDNRPDLAEGCVFELGYRRSDPIPVYCGPLSAPLLQSLRCDLLIIPTHKFSPEERARAARAAAQARSRVAFLAAQPFHDRGTTESIDLDDLVLVASNAPASRPIYGLAKRFADLTASSLFLVLLAPLFWLIALLIRLDSPGPALFIQRRVGRNGRLFNIYKFRSMYADTPQYDFSPIDTHDRRITRIGRFLRRTSLDELPQLINVLRGEMSLVGPRPEMPFIVQHYSARQRHRLEVTPGITGLWQLSADRAFQIHDNIHYDLYYICHRSFFMDLSILIHTLFFAMHGV